MDKIIKETFKDRITMGNEELEIAYSKLDPESETYFKDLSTVTGMERELANDSKAYTEYEASEKSNETELLSTIFRFIVGIGGAAVALYMHISGERNMNMRIDKISRFEDNDALLKTSDRIVVQDGLRRDKKFGILGNLFNK